MTYLKKLTSLSTALVLGCLAHIASVDAAPRSEQFEVPAGKEGYVGDVPDFGGQACFSVVDKATHLPARGHFRGLINGRPIDLDRHMGGRCLRFTRDGGLGLYRVYVLADEGLDLIVTRTVNEKNHDWVPGPAWRHEPT
ncbi:hypothetical protein NKK48_00715 [Mesorhizobium sp. C386A]|uniref:hypothetical protein n=1 Tax=unclassified Mesorhizobium TaxID=325217 RepID=UPI0003CF56C5|nr:hypothetical protein [Mesorhizobium sp. LNJC386A00]ESY29551.1 hypothetical protein X748_27690 [Mesorhizobium sp. LNJC386A00]